MPGVLSTEKLPIQAAGHAPPALQIERKA